ncbi:DUF6879 family protein [Actinokineospora globicatena]|uniref:DUF6879 domain-containing protein n=1 Tax=Actinokineospora globicatena TaxID=103729 RepID=A0A9W6QHG2_9PSEU|nr:DUF6879 family protein [Actinokineospora globicatena]GLW91126.1 hypothetical protein Aglo03_19420 [Actinokineospora globicatena]
MSTVFTSLDDAEFNLLFREFRQSVFRLETLQHYQVSYEKDEFARFLTGESRGEFPGISGWISGTVIPARAARKSMHRVHVVEEPLSDYVRFECAWAYEHTVPAGEDVRVITVERGQWPDNLPRAEYWLFDSELLVAMNYDEDGTFRFAEVITNAAEVALARQWRDTAMELSIPYREFAERYDGLFVEQAR